MADDFYGEEEGEDVAQPSEEMAVEEGEESSEREPKSEESETALVSDSFFPSECKVGDTYTVKVVAQHDGEKEISVHKKDAKESDGGVVSSMNDKIAAMAK